MLDPDISARQARRLLSRTVPRSASGDTRPEGPHGWTRRSFLQAVGLGLGGGVALGTLGDGPLSALLGGEVHDAFAGAPLGPDDRILVTIMLYGGNDGLNTVVPYSDSSYYAQRGSVSIPASTVLPLDAKVGLHPGLAFTKSLYDAGQVAIVQGVGYPGADLSHFTSMAIWMNGRFGGGAATSGWIGRWLDGQSASIGDLGAATIDTSVALHLVGEQRRAVSVSPYGDMFGTETAATDLRMYDGLRAMAAGAGRGQWHDMFSRTLRTQLDVARDVAPAFADEVPDGELVSRLTIAARLINADVGLRVLDVSLDGFDDHDGQLPNHAELLGELDAALRAFYATLNPQWRDRVTLLTQSEFGRTPWSNASGGTDHGTASDLFVIGPKVRGGLYGEQPSLRNLDRWDRVEHSVDFRSVIGSVVDGWMGGGGSTIVNGSFEDLRLFTGAGSGGSTGGTVVLPPSQPSGYVAVTPTRLLDTRDGTGGRSTPLGPQASHRLGVVGVAGVAADAVAVVLNVTAVDASAATFVTVHPNGVQRPLSSNLNPVPGRATPNLVVARVGPDGAVALFNNAGTVHLVADVVGYFAPSSTTGLLALDPARLLDTRDGTGGAAAALGQGAWIDVQVTGRGGVPAGAQAVALNVAATEPSATSYLTVWPAGEARPVASSVNMVPGATVSNMVFARVGEGGKVRVYNNTGSSHVVIDVLGAFVPGASSRYVAVSPARALDTREGVGAPRARLSARLSGGALDVGLTGRCGVPSSGVSAVLLNVTAVTPSAGTYVTVFPSGRGRPLASNLNVDPGQVVPNMVLARLGSNGAASMYNNTGDVDLVGDVMGYFTT
ncbi:MAG: DUF1501 domain-containing protein [Actinomycetota bacterium]